MIVQSYSIEPIQRNKAFVDTIEARMRVVPSLLDGSSKSLWSVVSAPGTAFFTVASYDYVGLIGVNNINYGKYADAHITFWDRRLGDKILVCQDIANFVMESAGLQMLLTHIPTNRTRLIEFAEGVGFRVWQEINGVTSLALLRGEQQWEWKSQQQPSFSVEQEASEIQSTPPFPIEAKEDALTD